MDDFIRQTLTISVAQICDNIGWHSITDTSMNLLTDLLHHYINDLLVTSKKYAEHAYSDVPDIGDVEKAFHQKSISLTDLRTYIKSTAPVQFSHSLPLLNVPGKVMLNTMKPGSREIFTRPIHIHEHLPTLNTEPVEEEQTTDLNTIDNQTVDIKQEPEEVIFHKRLREISSVVMTSSGFLSPSREGRLAESKLLPFPEVTKDKPFEPLSVLPETKENPSPTISKTKIKSKKLKSGVKKKQKGSKNRLIVKIKDQKPKVLKKIKKLKIDKIDKIIEPLVSEIKVKEEPVDEIDIVNLFEVPTKIIEMPKKIIPMSNTKQVKTDEALPKFSFFGPIHQSPELLPSTFPQIINTAIKIEKPDSPILFKSENEDICRKEQKKKKKDKKKEKKEKKKQKEKVKGKGKIKEKVKVKEKEKQKPKCIGKVPKIKLRFGTRMETVTKILPVEKPPNQIITVMSEIKPMKIVDIESKSDVSIDISCDTSSPKVPIQKIKAKIHTKLPQPSTPPPAIENPTPAFYFDDGGNQVWICPMCTKPDDGSPMIGCDGCDVWYHWVCVGIQCPPDCAVWYCPKCVTKRNQPPKCKRGRPRKNK